MEVKMKKIMVIILFLIYISFWGYSRTIEIKIKDVDWYCWGHGTYTCKIIIDDGKKKKGVPISREEAMQILGFNLPENAIPCVMIDSQIEHNPTRLLPSQYYSGLNDPDLRVLEGEWPDLPYFFPEQTVVYSEEWGGYIGYFINEVN